MSTSIYKPLGLTFCSTMPNTMFICTREIRKVKRVLFEPPDHVATQKFVDAELSKITVTQSEKWNFDFKSERTLDANGIYQWRLATPQKNTRPVKVRPTQEEDNLDIYAEPLESIRPTPARILEEEEMKSPPKSRQIQKPQRLITDYMMEKKRSAAEPTKKLDWAPMERPAKMPRLHDFTS